MSNIKPTGRVVAELGRPETAHETAARKAESSRLHRQRQTVNNLVYSLLATLGVVLIIVLMVPRSNPGTVGKPVDWNSVAAQGAGAEPAPLLSPELPKGWTANAAELRSGASDGIDDWHIGFISPSQQYVGLDQGFKANGTWATDQLDDIRATGSTTIDGVHWVVYDNRNGQSQSSDVTYGLVATHGVSTVVLSGTAKVAEFDTVARALAPQLGGTKQ
ncbi:DUF4245 domain-containing protein [Gryllotalpicola reticulitermitis]|uniref:DUF4245 domain-containing protein n=1 Tax=Gryllotalpicola reticulitermitis TaxID=1184153 RepID=A0ABV8Q0N8_9MICO